MNDMTFWDHLDALRIHLFRCGLVLLMFFCILFVYMPDIFDTVVMGPCFGDFPTYQWMCHMSPSFCDEQFQLEVVNIQLTSPFLIHLKISLLFALTLVLPYVLFELWKFISPALYRSEKVAAIKAFILSTVLFYLGMLLGYLIIFPITLRFLAGYQLSGLIGNQLSFDSYIQTFIWLNLMLGLAFELPVLSILLSKMGLLNKKLLQKYRKHAIVLLVVVSAIVTPTGDPFTLALVSVPLIMLYELSVVLIGKRNYASNSQINDIK